MKQIGIWGGITVIFIAGIWGMIWLVNNNNPTVSSKVSAPPPLAKDDQVLGAADKVKATLIEYADFQCPACAYYSLIVRQLEEDLRDDLLIVYRYFPLISIHKNAMSSSQAAFAAGKQNKFWEMSDLLYENQENWSDSSNAQEIFTGYAKKLDLDITQFIDDYNAETTKKFITDQMNSGISMGINSTPSFFINGKKIENPRSYDDFKKIVQDEINKK